MNQTDIVAWYAAIISSVSLGLQGLNAWLDRARIVIDPKFGMRVSPGGPYDPAEDYIVVTVRNAGRRPRTIEKVGFRLRKGNPPEILASDCFFKGPRELIEGQSDIWAIEQGTITPPDVDYFWAIDQTGKQFKKKI